MNNNFYKIICIISAIYLFILSVYLLAHGQWFSPDQFFAAALLGVLILGRARQFMQDWLSPLILFFSYEALRGLLPHLTNSAHIFPMIRFDQFFFGEVPSVTLQRLLHAPGIFKWYDYLSVLLYESHFVAFLLVGFIFWLVNRELFKKYFFALLVLSYMSFVTFVIFPAMPPWMAAQQGFIPPLADISNQVFATLPKAISLPTIYHFFGANLVAAVPSIHAAFPWLTFLFVFARAKIAGLLLTPYVFGVWFALVYLGDHYVFDIIAGVLYATIAYLIVDKLRPRHVYLCQ